MEYFILHGFSVFSLSSRAAWASSQHGGWAPKSKAEIARDHHIRAILTLLVKARPRANIDSGGRKDSTF
jgi:hypothetical protein